MSKTLSLCDRCGFQYKLETLRHEFVNERETGLLVCRTCWDDDHPQLYGLKKIKFDDPKPIRNTRPEVREGAGFGLWGWNPIGNSSTEVRSTAGTIRVRVG